MPKTLNDPEEVARIKAWYEEPIFESDLTNEELMEQKVVRTKLTINQAK